jgi:DNA-binding response OmpR family regulator
VKVLLVEDTIGKPVQSILQKSGHDVLLATSIGSAQRHLGQPGIDLFLLDWMLPDGSGLDLVQTIRRDANYRDASILMMSSRSDRSDIVTAIRSGIDGYLAKPFRPSELRSRLNEVWQRRNGQRSLRQKVELLVGRQTLLDRHGETPLVVLGEGATTVAALERSENGPVLEHLATATTMIAAANAFLPTLELGYCLSQSTGDVSKLLRQRATRNRVQLAVVSTQCQGNCMVMARLLHLRGAEDMKLCVVDERWSELSSAERTELDSYGVPILRRSELDANRWRDIIEMQVIRRWSPELHEQFIGSGLRDDSLWEDLDMLTG